MGHRAEEFRQADAVWLSFRHQNLHERGDHCAVELVFIGGSEGEAGTCQVAALDQAVYLRHCVPKLVPLGNHHEIRRRTRARSRFEPTNTPSLKKPLIDDIRHLAERLRLFLARAALFAHQERQATQVAALFEQGEHEAVGFLAIEMFDLGENVRGLLHRLHLVEVLGNRIGKRQFGNLGQIFVVPRGQLGRRLRSGRQQFAQRRLRIDLDCETRWRRNGCRRRRVAWRRKRPLVNLRPARGRDYRRRIFRLRRLRR